MTPTQQRSPAWKWWVCGVLLLATFLNYMDRQAMAVTLPELKRHYHVVEGRIGLIEGTFGYAFAFGSIFVGLLADRYGPRLLYPAVLVGWSLAGIATGLAGRPEVTGWLDGVGGRLAEGPVGWLIRGTLDPPYDEPGAGTFRWLLLCRILLGFCEAGHWPCALITARQLLTAKDRPLGNAVLQSGASLGAIVVPLYAEVVERLGLGWEFVFLSIGGAGLVWVPLWRALVRRRDLDGATPPAAVPNAGGWGGFTRHLVMLAIIVSCLNVSWQFLRAWLPLFLQDFHGYSRELTRVYTSVYFISTDIGCILAGVLAAWLVARGWGVSGARKLGFTAFTGLTGLAAAVPWVGPGPVMIAFLMVAGAGILGLHPYYYALVQELPARRMGVISGGLAAVGWVVSGQFQIYVGAEIERTRSYDTGLVIVGLAPLVALTALLVLGRSGRPGDLADRSPGTRRAT
jgi:ACS family hexuronate transporter-like MFS transporter